MSEAVDITIEILKSIRDEIRGTNARLDQTNERLDQTNERLDRLEVRVGRVEQGLVDLGKFMRRLARDMEKYEKFHHHHVEVIEKDVEDLKARVRSVEERLPPR